GLNLGDVSTTGGLSLDSNGDIQQLAGTTVSVQGSTAVHSSGGSVLLASAGNTFGGQVTAMAGTGSSNSVILNATGSLTTSASAGGNGTVQSSGDVNAQLNLGGSGSVTSSAGAVNLQASSVGGDLAVTALGNITQSGPLSVGGDTTVKTLTGTVDLSDPGNSFSGALTINTPFVDPSEQSYQPQLPSLIVETAMFTSPPSEATSSSVSTSADASGSSAPGVVTDAAESVGDDAGSGFGTSGSLGSGLNFVSVTTQMTGSAAESGDGTAQTSTSEQEVTAAINNALLSSTGVVQAISVDGGTRNPDDAIVAE
uniref:hypothetical protein n=1 Tax=Hydrogenophaga sp. TaxID=1904254 RepID=UPI00286E3E91